jgi:hypothetical protein
VRREHGDVPVLRALTAALGANMWFNCILVLTHGAAAPPDNNAGPMTYDVYANQRTHGLQQAIRFAAGDQRLLNPVAPAENHANCRRNAAGDPVLPNGQPWKQQLLLLCLSSKILSDADSLLKISASSTGPSMRLQNMLRGQRLPPIPHLLSIMVQPKQPRRYPEDERDIMREDEIAALPTEEERRREVRGLLLPAPARTRSWDAANPSMPCADAQAARVPEDPARGGEAGGGRAGGHPRARPAAAAQLRRRRQHAPLPLPGAARRLAGAVSWLLGVLPADTCMQSPA